MVGDGSARTMGPESGSGVIETELLVVRSGPAGCAGGRFTVLAGIAVRPRSA